MKKNVNENGPDMILIFVLIFLSCAWINSFISTTPNESSMKYVGRERLRSKLRDPDSLQIISEKIENGEYKAEYRAKNGFGGYNKESFNTR